MFIPFRTDRRLQSIPWANIALIAINVVVYGITSHGSHGMGTGPEYRAYMLDPVQPTVFQFISYQFLHANLMHLGGNMLFLWVFGNSVEDRLGKVGYLAFYLAGGVVAGLGHCMFEHSPVLGASGAVCAVTGAYLALFPMSNVTVFYFFFFIGTFEIASIWLLLIQFGENLLMQLGGGSGVAYLAHLSGYTYGFAVGMTLLATRVLPREPYDLLSMYTHYRRRAEFRKLTRRGYRPWELDRNATPPGGPKGPAEQQQERVMAMRSRISQALATHDLDTAARLYTELLELDPAQVMGRQQQVDLANQLVVQGRLGNAAIAYELFLNTYRSDPQREEIELMLGALYTRHLNRRQRARELLASAMPRLHSNDQRNLAQQLMAEIEA